MKTPLMKAAAAGDLDTLRTRLAHSDVNAKDKNGDTALHAACANGHVTVARWLVEAGAMVDARNKGARDSVLHAAVMAENVEVIRFLVIEAGLDVDIRNKWLRTPLHQAAALGTLNAVKELLHLGAALAAEDNSERQALYLAAENGRRDVVEYLVASGSDVNADACDGYQPIHGAAKSGDIETIEILVRGGANPHSLTERHGYSALQEAASSGALEAVKFFIRIGLNVNGSRGLTPYELAARDGHSRVVEILEDAGADTTEFEKHGFTALQLAAQKGDVETMTRLAERGDNFSCITADARTLLHMAAASGSLEAVQLCLTKGLEIDARDADSHTPAYEAARRGHHAIVEFFVDAGVDTTAIEAEGWLPIQLAAQAGDVSKMKLLVERGANLSCLTKYSKCVLRMAVSSGSLDAIRFCLAEGLVIDGRRIHNRAQGSIEAQDDHNPEGKSFDEHAANAALEKRGWQLIQLAAQAGDVETMTRLAEHGDNFSCITVDARTLLHMAAASGSLEAVQLCLTKGLEIDARDADSHTPAYEAARRGHHAIVEFFVDAGVDTTAIEAEGWLPIQLAAQAGDVSKMKLLVERGANLSCLTKEGTTLLHMAASTASLETVQYCVDNSLEVEVLDKSGRTPLVFAAANGHLSIVTRLLDLGALDGCVDIDGWTPLHYAAQSGDLETMKLLAGRGCDVHRLTKDAETVLHMAASSGTLEFVQYCVSSGADIDARDVNEQTPLFHACLNRQKRLTGVTSRSRNTARQTAVVQWLLDGGACLDAEDKDGNATLHAAASGGDAALVDLLVAAGFGDTDIQNEKSWMPAHAAVNAGNMTTLLCLVKHGSDVCARKENGSTTILEVAAATDNVEVMRYLLKCMKGNMSNARLSSANAAKHGAMNAVKEILHWGYRGKFNPPDEALVVAAENGDVEMAEYLLDRGASMTGRDRKYVAPLVYAARDVKMLMLFHGYGADLSYQSDHMGQYGGLRLVHIAAEHGSRAAVKYIVESGVDVDTTFYFDAMTPLLMASAKGHRDVVEYLLDAGADFRRVDKKSLNALNHATKSGDFPTIKLLVDRKVDLHGLGEVGEGVLHTAAGEGLLDVVKFFVSIGFNIEAKDEHDRTPLAYAVGSGHIAVVRVLLESGANVDASSIHETAYSGNVEIIQLLIAHGGDVHSKNKENETVLDRAITWTRYRSEITPKPVEAVKFFLERGVRFNLDKLHENDNYKGKMPLHEVAEYGEIDAAKMLLLCGVDVDATTKRGKTALVLTMKKRYADSMETMRNKTHMVKLLLENGADKDWTDESGRSLLHMAAKHNNAPTTELLLQFGVDVNAKTKAGSTPLHFAIHRGDLPDVAIILVRNGADVQAVDPDGGYPPFISAVRFDTPELLELILEKGGDLNSVMDDGQTALHVAAKSEKKKAVKFLLRRGIDIYAVDKEGRTALHRAKGRYSSSTSSDCIWPLLQFGDESFVDLRDNDGYRALHLRAAALNVDEMTQLLEAHADVHGLSNNGESPLQLAVFAERSDKTLPAVLALCKAGAEWTAKCEEKLQELAEDLAVSDEDGSGDQQKNVLWYTGLRACILHWETQYREGIKRWTKIPVEVIERGDVSVKTYVADATSSNANELVYRCKVCVVGPSEWGKSSLVRSIETMKPFLIDAKDRTIGIDLVSSSFGEGSTTASSEAEGESAKRHEVTFWDFAGQDVYQVAHSLFFSSRTLYVLVVDAKAYADQLDAVKSLRSAAVEAAMDRFLSRYVFRWIRTIFSRQPDAEFLVLGTKADLLEDEESESSRVWSDLQSRIYQWKVNYARELQEEAGNQSRLSSTKTKLLTNKLMRLASDQWLVVSVTRNDSIRAVRRALQRSIEDNERGFPMWTKYSRVLAAITQLRAASRMRGNGQYRMEHGMMLFRPLCRLLMDQVENLEYDECHAILRTLHDLGDVIWYESGQLRDFIIIDPVLVIDIVREVISHEHETTAGVVVDNQEEVEAEPAIDGLVSHALLTTLPLWSSMDKELMYAFKTLLNQFHLAYPANDEVMDPESDLIVPSYWTVQFDDTPASGGTQAASKLQAEEKERRLKDYCWEYDVYADLADTIFDQFAVQSYTSFMKRTVRSNCIESSCAEFESWITLRRGTTKHDFIRVEVASADADLAWINMRYYLMKLEKVLDEYSGLTVPRHVVVDGKRHSLSPATKAIRDSIMMGRDVNELRVQMPWLPPDLDWFITRAWRDLSSFREMQMMHLVRDKLHVLQKLVVKGNSQRRYPALWSLEYKADEHVVVLRMLSDLSGRCYHVPIEIEVPLAFLAKHGSTIKEGISLLANVAAHFLTGPILQTAIDGTASCLDVKSQQATQVHNLIERLSLTTSTGTVINTSSESGLSPGGTMAILKDLLKLHNDSLDELSITEICNLECAATSKGEYVWAHAHEISMLKKELTPCQPRFEADSATSSMVKSSARGQSPQPSKFRLNLCIKTVEGLTDWDWYKTYCTWQLFYGDVKTPLASGATTTNADSTVQPSWRSLNAAVDAVDSVEMLQECRLVVQVKRRSRVGWNKLIGEGEVQLQSLVSVDAKLSLCCDPIEVELQASGSASTRRIVQCEFSASN